jgi:hypothetical protein
MVPADHPSRNKCLGRALLGQGKTEEAIQIFIKSDDRSDRAYLGNAHARSGRREEAEKLAIDLSASHSSKRWSSPGWAIKNAHWRHWIAWP